jgi:hypothetical protein
MSIADYRLNLAGQPRCGVPLYTANRTYRCIVRGIHGVHFDEPEGEPARSWSYNGTGTILRNRAACLSCGEVIESAHVHDFQLCSCGSLHVDGGNAYLKRGIKPGVLFEDMSLFVPRLRPEVSISRAAALGWLDKDVACGSCGKPFENDPQPTVQRTYFAPECQRCSEARKEAVIFIGTHLRMVQTGTIPAGVECPYRHTCAIYLKNECPRIDNEAPFSCAAARGLAYNYPAKIGR